MMAVVHSEEVTMAMRETIERHREAGRGRQAFWLVAALILVAAIVWFAPARAGLPYGFRHGGEGDGRFERLTLSEKAAAIRRHSGLLERAGLSQAQVDSISKILDQSSLEIERIELVRGALTERAAVALASDAVDTAELAAIEAEVANLAAEAIHATFDVVEEVVAELTKEQRTDLIAKWTSRR
jgi:Spy/CpxP family protein refolding chaperone